MRKRTLRVLIAWALACLPAAASEPPVDTGSLGHEPRVGGALAAPPENAAVEGGAAKSGMAESGAAERGAAESGEQERGDAERGLAPASSPADACPVDFFTARAEEWPAWEDDPLVAVRKKAWEDALGGQAAARPHIQARLRGWPERVLVDRASLPRDDRAFLERLARDTWRGLDALADRENGLPVDHVRLGRTSTALDEAQIGDYANVTTIGLYLVDLVAARELGLVSPAEALARISGLLDTLGRLERHDGFFFNYYDTTSLERTSNFISFVDSSWLAAGLVVVRNALPELAPRASDLLARMDFRFFYDDRLGQMSHGYYVHRRARSRYHYGVLYTEARIGVLIAIGKGDVPPEAWFRMVRTFPPSCTGQTLVPAESRRTTLDGVPVWTGWYEWRGRRYVPSWGGSMFEALMPTLVLDELRWAERSLGANDRVHADVQRLWALEELGWPVWGLSPSATPTGNGYREYGARVLGSRGYPSGGVTPHAAALALVVAPDEATAALRRIAELYAAWGEYGLYDALDPTSGEVTHAYLALDQSMLFLAVANHLTGGAVRARFSADAIAQRVIPLLGEEAFFD